MQGKEQSGETARSTLTGQGGYQLGVLERKEEVKGWAQTMA